MPKEIFKNVKAVFKCKNCNKKFTKRFIAEGLTEVSTTQIEPHVLAHSPNICSKCGYNSFEITYAFYHEKKLLSNGEV